MKILLTILFLSLLSSPSWSASGDIVIFDDLVERKGLYYKKFSVFPFSGKGFGIVGNGSIKNGKKEGRWFGYWVANGQLKYTSNYKNGKKEGKWRSWHLNGQLDFKGNYKNGKEEGECVYYNKDGSLNKKQSGTFKNGVKISD